MDDSPPLGPEVDPHPAKRPERVTLTGRYVDVVPLDPIQHGDALFEATTGSDNDALWAYLFDGPFRDRASFDRSLARKAATDDPFFFAIVISSLLRST